MHRLRAIGGLRRSLGVGLTMVPLSLFCAACGGSPTVLTAFRSEQQAQEHCPEDTIVWLDPQSGIMSTEKAWLVRAFRYGSLCVSWRSGTGWYARDGELRRGIDERAHLG